MDANTRARMEVAMMYGNYIQVPDSDNNKAYASDMIQYALDTAGITDTTGIRVIEQATKYTKQKIAGMSFSMIMREFRVINIVFCTMSGKQPKLTLKDGTYPNDGTFAYVYNMDAPDLSELGTIFYEMRNGLQHRI